MKYEKTQKAELSILVYSCWKNSDMWTVFIRLFRKYWHDCAYPLVLLTDKVGDGGEKYGFDEVVVLDGNWNEMVLAGMNALPTQYVMLWMDDYLLCDDVDNHDIALYMNIAQQYHAANIRLMESPSIKSGTFAQDERLNCYKQGSAYSFSTQVGIWDVKLLKKYIKNYQTPWDFERKGSVEIKDEKHPLLAPKYYTFPYEEGVRQGKWLDNGVRLCKRNNITLDFKKRRPMRSFELAWIYFKGGILELNPTLIVKIQNIWNDVKNHVKEGSMKVRFNKLLGKPEDRP